MALGALVSEPALAPLAAAASSARLRRLICTMTLQGGWKGEGGEGGGGCG